MKRFINPILWSAVVSLFFLSLLIVTHRTHAESSNTVHLERKVSKDILKKAADGQGADLVRVIIQTAQQSDAIDSTLEESGGSNIRKFNNFAIRVVTLPVNAAMNIAARSDVSYVSLNRDVRPLGHLSRTTGADQIRNSGPGNNSSSIDGTGIGIAVVDSGIDAAHQAFLDRSNGVRLHGRRSDRRSIRARHPRRLTRGR